MPVLESYTPPWWRDSWPCGQYWVLYLILSCKKESHCTGAYPKQPALDLGTTKVYAVLTRIGAKITTLKSVETNTAIVEARLTNVSRRNRRNIEL